MPHISKEKLERKVFLKIHNRFVKTITEINTKKESQLFLKDLLTQTERIMLAKRLTILFMLIEKISRYRIMKTLKVSPSTIARMSVSLDNGQYNFVKKLFRKKKNREAFWKEIEALTRGGMPKMASGRWEWLFEEKKR